MFLKTWSQKWVVVVWISNKISGQVAKKSIEEIAAFCADAKFSTFIEHDNAMAF